MGISRAGLVLGYCDVGQRETQSTHRRQRRCNFLEKTMKDPTAKVDAEPKIERDLRPHFWIKSLTFNDGTNLELQRNEIVVFVGPNNSGKSVTLKELSGWVGGQRQGNKIITSVETERTHKR
jgi:ABC-type multidrug transport system ATPase subunit